ncbi:4-hydroxyphenylacetate 3-monooxygenase, oxygenase component [Tuberibacillus sp. Marseille-P3662]|uniref:4-hydroxyphenylacetate 3-monooxygenase, oxygenase component n=1 Tax=Tuberibacillus sp. Marseille-P3662 TaxID=1965358 RepID=UPI000A1CB99D|nr:4-hydroxyphenylacetate 3-monooxygenase, oxygenase component [Tuberibacillus sp. Marseille-P3662]
MSIIDGEEYIRRINALNSNIWVGGEQVTGPISKHPAFKGLMESQAKWFDLRNQPDLQDRLTWTSDTTGNQIGTSYMPPKTIDDLKKRRLAIQTLARESCGLLGRSPDYMNTALMTFGTSADILQDQSTACMNNMRDYYEYAREHDLTITHTFVEPQVNRSSFYMEESKNIVSARIIDENDEGIVIHGARLLATQGATTDEIMVFPSGARLPKTNLMKPKAYAFAIPNDTPGLKFICRESFDYGKSHFDHPLASRFEEMDTIVIFDHVTVPWNRVFIHGDIDVNNRLYHDSSYFPHVTHQVVCKNVVKLEFILGVAQAMIDSIHVGEYQHIHEKVSEIIVALEAMKGFIYSSEAQAELNSYGIMTPNIKPLRAATKYFPTVYPRMRDIIQNIGASGLVSIPGEADFNHEQISDDLNHYLQTSEDSGEDKVRLFRLAWDLSMSAFGSRQSLYERYFFGDPVKTATILYHSYEREDVIEWVRQFLYKN